MLTTIKRFQMHHLITKNIDNIKSENIRLIKNGDQTTKAF